MLLLPLPGAREAFDRGDWSKMHPGDAHKNYRSIPSLTMPHNRRSTALGFVTDRSTIQMQQVHHPDSQSIDYELSVRFDPAE